jgi:signal transduction histidine kinase/CheY-like chemotaxis protein
VDDRRVLIFPPTRRDGDVTRDLLERAGLSCYVCYDALILARELDLGAGTMVLTDAALVAPNFDSVLAVLGRQPPWSDLPVVLLCQAVAQSAAVARIIASMTNVVLLDRPASARTLISAVQTAIRARLRQYETREQLRALREAEEALLGREQQLHIADRRKDEFLAMLAHELRNPLAPIRNASEFLARMLPAEPHMQASVGIVKRQVAHLTRLVDDLLDVSRITQGRIELQCHPVDLKTIVAQGMESVEPLMREKRHKVFVASSDGPIWVNGDGARLVQCMSNILTNSAKYTDRGGEIHIETRKEPPDEAVVTITDNGLGISEDLLPQIFQLFVQSDRSLDRSQGGLGIGLSVVQRLVDMHGGRVSAHSAGPGKGSTFEIRLPLIEAPQDVPPQNPVKHMRRKRVLIVDDNEDAANSMALLLNHEGHTAESVYSAAEALERALAPEHPDLILLDIGLPGMDGYEVARRLRARGSTAELVALTGYGQIEDRQRAEAAGFDAHLVKPVDLHALLQRLAS